MFKILVSAYACEPEKGSEPTTGWGWVNILHQKGHQLTVITRKNNQSSIEKAIQGTTLQHIAFHYIDLPYSFTRLKKLPFMVQPYYLLWQLLAYFYAKKQQLANDIDLIHHVTFSTFRHTNFLYLLNKPLVFGTVGGGEHAPLNLTIACGGIKNTLIEFLRLFSNQLANCLPWHQAMYKKAHTLVAATQETSNYFPKGSKDKTIIATNIGLPEFIKVNTPGKRERNSKLKLLYVGRFIYWKGLPLLLKALTQCHQQGIEFELTLIGEGSEKKNWEQEALKLGIAEHVVWKSWMKREELTECYKNADYFAFPSLHDSSGNVVIEAMANGLPIICFNLGGPGFLVDETCGLVVEAREKSTQQVIQDLAEAISTAANNPKLRENLSNGALTHVQNYTWDALYERVYGFVLPRLSNVESSN